MTVGEVRRVEYRRLKKCMHDSNLLIELPQTPLYRNTKHYRKSPSRLTSNARKIQSAISNLVDKFRCRLRCPVAYHNDIVCQNAIPVLDVAMPRGEDPVCAGEDDGCADDEAGPVHVV